MGVLHRDLVQLLTFTTKNVCYIHRVVFRGNKVKKPSSDPSDIMNLFEP